MTNTETSAHPRRPAKETRCLGEDIYERDIRAQAENDHLGEIEGVVNAGYEAVVTLS